MRSSTRQSQPRVGPRVRNSAKWSSRARWSSTSQASLRRPCWPPSRASSSSRIARTAVDRAAGRGYATARAASGRSRRSRRPPSGCRSRRRRAAKPRVEVARATRTLARTPASVTAPPVDREVERLGPRSPTRPRAAGPSGSAGRRAPRRRSRSRRARGPDGRPTCRRSRRGSRAPCPRGPSQAPLGDLGVATVRDERGHPTDRVGAAPVAGLHQQFRVGAHERHGHRQLGAIGRHRSGERAEHLDRAEQVVPAAGVQARGVLAQLVQDLVHLERRE